MNANLLHDNYSKTKILYKIGSVNKKSLTQIHFDFFRAILLAAFMRINGFLVNWRMKSYLSKKLFVKITSFQLSFMQVK